MDDTHAVILDLDRSQDASTAFFAVYDGHSGQAPPFFPFSNPLILVASVSTYPGSKVAQFARQNVHKRLVREEAYRNKDHETALKRAFLGTDEDIRAGMSDGSLLSSIQISVAGCIQILAVHKTPLDVLQSQP
jgi:protein phosphatase 2C family protein 2/3